MPADGERIVAVLAAEVRLADLIFQVEYRRRVEWNHNWEACLDARPEAVVDLSKRPLMANAMLRPSTKVCAEQEVR